MDLPINTGLVRVVGYAVIVVGVGLCLWALSLPHVLLGILGGIVISAGVGALVVAYLADAFEQHVTVMKKELADTAQDRTDSAFRTDLSEELRKRKGG